MTLRLTNKIINNIHNNRQEVVDFLNQQQMLENREIESIDCESLSNDNIIIISIIFGNNRPHVIYALSGSVYNNKRQVLLVDYWYICFDDNEFLTDGEDTVIVSDDHKSGLHIQFDDLDGEIGNTITII